MYSWTSMVRTSLGLRKFVRDMGSLNHCGLIKAPVQEANGDNLGNSFLFLCNNGMLSVLDGAILTHNIQFHTKIRKFPQIFVFWGDRKNYVGTRKLVQMSHVVNEPSVFKLLRFDCSSKLQICVLFLIIVKHNHKTAMNITKTCLYNFDPSNPTFI